MPQFSSLDLVVVLSFVLLAVSSLLLTGFIVPVVLQLTKTLAACESLATTVDKEIGVTLSEVNKLMSGLGDFKNVASHKVSQITQSVDDVKGNVTNVTKKAQIHTSVLGTGILSGIQAYLKHNNGNK